MRKIVLFAACALIALPSTAQQAERTTGQSSERYPGRYVGSRSLAADGVKVEWRADRVVDSMRGVASAYASSDAGRRTSSGERHDPSSMTAAHATFAIDSMVRVTNIETGRRIVVRVNDRMDRTETAVIRLSRTAAGRLGVEPGGQWADADVHVELLSSRTVPAVVVARRYDEAESDQSSEGMAAEPGRVVSGPQHPDEIVRPVRAETTEETGTLEDRYTLQVGAFSTLDAARRLAADIEGAWVMQVMEDGERVFRVYYGQYDREQQARSAQKRLEKRGRDSFLRRIPA